MERPSTHCRHRRKGGTIRETGHIRAVRRAGELNDRESSGNEASGRWSGSRRKALHPDRCCGGSRARCPTRSPQVGAPNRVADRVVLTIDDRRNVVPICHRGCLYPAMTVLSESTVVSTQPAAPRHDTTRLLVTILQAAETLSLSRSSIYQLIANNQLTPIRIGRSVRLL